MCEVEVVYPLEIKQQHVGLLQHTSQDASCCADSTTALAVATPPAAAATTQPCGWSALPREVLVQILQHVPVQERFRHCALVGTDWAAAAVEATTTVDPSERCLHLSNLQYYLTKHGRRITVISLTGQRDEEVSLLPCLNLLQLDLSEVTVQLSAAAGRLFPGVLHSIPSLKRLTLHHASVIGGPEELTRLSALPDLQHLALVDLDTAQGPPGTADWFPVPGSLLSQLLKLTHLELDRCVASSTLEHLSGLNSLKHLLLGRLLLHHTSAAALSGLESLPQLQWLRLEGLQAPISTSSIPGLGGLTKLTKLQLLNCKGFQPILLSGMLDMEELDLQGTPLLGTGGVQLVPVGGMQGGGGGGAAAPDPGGDGDDDGGDDAGSGAGEGTDDDAAEAEDHQEAAAAPDGAVAEDAPGAGGGAGAAAADPEAAAPHQEVAQAEAHAAAGAATLLLELPKMQHLRSLSLVQVLWAHAAGQPPAAYSALTASSKLQQLDLSFSLIPAAAWYRMFDPATVSLPDLTSVYILCSQAPITDTHLECMVQCCPKLSTLWIKGSLQHGAQLTGLAGAKTLTSLSLNHVSSDAALAVLAELQGLEELQMSVVSSICASGMLQLSALKALIRLRVESSPETWIAKYGLVLFVNKAPAGAAPDVCLQLESWCLQKMGAACRSPADEDTAASRKKRGRRFFLKFLADCIGF